MGLTRSKQAEEHGTVAAGRGQLLADLESADPAARRNAARLLAGHCDSVDALAARLRVESEPSVVETLLTAIGRTDGPRAVSTLVDLLRDEDAVRRNGAIETLQEMDPEAVLQETTGLLDDPDSDVRIFALGVLQRLRHPAAGRLARHVIATDAHVNVCAAAVEVLAEIGTPDMVADLEAVAGRFRAEPFMAFAVTAAIKRIA
ncbi:MAG: HEAT repeat domain-containing protein [Methylacidiphilales bacterium]|nr:HEAT repeat domain-containing protein [Candidatus Methylacidiphilales bacterium]